jgi:Family of unknown function (DUF6350)
VTDVRRDRGGRAGAATLSRGGAAPERAAAGPVATVLTAAVGPAVAGLAVLTAVVLVGWITDTRGTASAGAAIRLAADTWLLAHGGVLHYPGGSADAMPLGLTALAAGLLFRAGAAAGASPAASGRRGPVRLVVAMAGLYGLIAAFVATAAGTASVHVGVPSAVLGATGLAAVAGGAGAVRSAGLGAAVAARLPGWAPAVARAAAVAVAVLLAAGAFVVAGSLALHGGRARDLTDALDPGLSGGILLALTGLVLVPNAAVWTTGFIAGPGFAVGAGTSVSPFAVTLGPVPALPLLAALPQTDTPLPAVRAVLLVPILAGALCGLVISRSAPGGAVQRARHAAYAALAGGAAMAVLAVLAGGSVGGGYLTAVGPSPWQLAAATALEVGVPAALVAAVLPGRTATPAAGEPSRAGEPAAAGAAADPPAGEGAAPAPGPSALDGGDEA